MSILVAYNSQAGGFSKKRFERFVDAFARTGQKFRIVDSHDEELPRHAESARHICVYGGDGTLRDVLDRIGQPAAMTTMSVYPAGTINLVAREAGYPVKEAIFAAQAVTGNAAKQFYSAMINDQRFLACASIGPDSYSVARLSPFLKRRIGRYAYAAAFLQQFFRWQRRKLDITADGAHYRGEAAYILKGRYFAGPWQLDRKADLASNHLALVILPRARRSDFLRLCLSATLWKGFAPKDCIRLTCKNIEINCEQAAPVQADGDIVGQLPVRIAMAEGALSFT